MCLLYKIDQIWFVIFFHLNFDTYGALYDNAEQKQPIQLKVMWHKNYDPYEGTGWLTSDSEVQ